MNFTDATDLETIKTKIEKMKKQQHIEILKIIKSNNHSLNTNENKNGTWINMGCLSIETIEALAKYVSYIEDQENTLNLMESEKKTIISTYF
jgi:tRNA U34 5-carboxymethylaminomethyl modifying enzyme MnmG/GidA